MILAVPREGRGPRAGSQPMSNWRRRRDPYGRGQYRLGWPSERVAKRIALPAARPQSLRWGHVLSRSPHSFQPGGWTGVPPVLGVMQMVVAET
jgi:hypothetical protein